MITVHTGGRDSHALPARGAAPPGGRSLASHEGPAWIDLLNPTPEEYKEVEARIGLALPRREDMIEIEASSRVYSEDEAIFITIVAPYRVAEKLLTSPVTFVLTRHCLTTIRHVDMPSFKIFTERAAHARGWSSVRAFIEAIEIIVDRAADGVERIGGEIEKLSHAVFGDADRSKNAETTMQAVLISIGRRGEDLSRLRDSLLSMSRGIPYLTEHAEGWGDEDLSLRLKTVERDLASLQDYDGFLSGKVSFLLDATIGLVGIQQNKVMKVFTVISMVFMPPTLIAGIYGMNFKFIPEYDFVWGYPAALCLMAITAIGPYVYFKRRGWF